MEQSQSQVSTNLHNTINPRQTINPKVADNRKEADMIHDKEFEDDPLDEGTYFSIIEKDH